MNCDQYAERTTTIIQKVEKIKASREAALDTEEGETLSSEDITDIYIEVMAEYRNNNNLPGEARDKKGDYVDYLETRRPFGAATQ